MSRKWILGGFGAAEAPQAPPTAQQWALEWVMRPDGAPLATIVRGALDEAERVERLGELPQTVRAYDETMPPGVLGLAQRLSYIHQAVSQETIGAAGHNRITLFYSRQVGEHRDDHPHYHPSTWAILCCIDCSQRGELHFPEFQTIVNYGAGDCVIFDRTQLHRSGEVCDCHMNATAYSRGPEPGVFERES